MQTAVDYKYLNFVKFQNFDKWYVSYYINPHNLLSDFEFVKLGRLIKPEKQKIKRNDYQKDIRVVKKISFADGKIHLRGENKTNMDLYIVNYSDLLVSKINFHQGALAINKIEKLVSTTHYQPYSIDRELVLDEYLILALRSKKFQEYLRFLRAEGIKNEATYEFISELQIPLPTLTEQEAIVNAYQSKIQQAQKLEQQAQDLEGEIEGYLNSILGIEYKEKQKHSGLYFTPFKSLERWDLWNKNLHFNNSKHNIVKLNSLLKLKSGSFLPASKMIEGNYIVYGGNGQNGTHNNYMLEGKRLVMGRVGAYCGNVHLINGKYWITDNAFIVDKISEDTSYEFLEIGLNHLKLNNYKVLSAQPSISQSNILQLEFPLPTFKLQEQIVENVQNMKSQIQQLKTKHSQLLTQAEQEFEQALFS